MARPKARGDGDGAIYQRADGQWCAAISLGYDAKGKRKRRVIYGKTRREVRDKLQKLQLDLTQGKSIEPNKITVEQVFADWLKEKKLHCRPGTWYRDEGHVRNHIVPYLGWRQIRTITKTDIVDFYLHLREETELSARTIHDISTILRSGLRSAVPDIIASSPADQVRKPPKGEKEARFLDKKELKQFMVALQGERLEPLFVLLVHTGLRIGEALGLAWDKVDLQKKCITITQGLHEVNWELSLGEPKTEAGKRTIALSVAAVQALRARRKQQIEEQLTAGAAWNNEGNLVFTGPQGEWLKRSDITKYDLARICHRADLDKVNLHALRHTHASLLICQGVDAKTISARMGHADITTTLRTYTHIMPGQDERAAKAMDDLMATL